MKKYLVRTLAIASLACALLVGNFAFADDEVKFTIKEGAENEICQEMANILREPENKKLVKNLDQKQFKFIKHSFTLHAAKNLNIPQKYTNFRLPEWQNLTVKELDKYIPPHASKFDWIDKNKKKIKKIQRTLFDFGINNNGVEVIRINSGTKTICDIGLSYNLDDYERDYGGDCELLYYKNDGYRIESSASLFIYKLLYPNTNSFSKERVCMISMN